MNTIKVDKEYLELKNQTTKLEIDVNKLDLIVKGNVCIYDYNENNKLELNIEVTENSSLVYYMFNEKNFDNMKIKIDNKNNSKTNFNYSFVSDKISKLEINNNILGNNIDSNIRVRAVSRDNGNIVVDSNGTVIKDTIDNNFNEDLRGLILGDSNIKINPDMYIDSNEVTANHNSTIGSINEDYLFYLNSKGIEIDEAKKLIVSGFINSILDSEFFKDK